MNLLSEAQGRLSSLESATANRRAQLQDWATQRLGQLNDARLSLAGSANFSPQDIVFQELQMAGIDPTRASQSQMTYNPYAIAQKRREDFLGA